MGKHADQEAGEGRLIYLEPIGLPESLRIRRSEWGLACILAGWGYVLLDPYPTFSNPTFVTLSAWASETAWAWACLILGLFRLVVLYINGRWRHTPIFRALTAFFCCFAWLTIALGLLSAGTKSPGIVAYMVFLVMDLHTVGIAAAEWKATNARPGKDGY